VAPVWYDTLDLQQEGRWPMAAGPGPVLEQVSRSSAAKWRAISSATENWPKTIRMAFLLLVVEIPFVISVLIWPIHT
jgi:hypothetical protein